MQREVMQSIITDCFYNIHFFGNLDRKLEAVMPFAEKKGLTADQIMSKLMVDIAENWNTNIARDMSKNSETKYLDGSYYGQLADLAASDIQFQMSQPGEWVEETINELRVSIRIYLSNLTKALDVFTGVYDNYQTKLLIDQIRSSVEVDTDKNKQLEDLLKKTTLSHEVASILQEMVMSEDYRKQIFGFCMKYLIKSNLLLDDIVLRLQYEEKVCHQARSLLEPLIYSLSRHDAGALINIITEAEQVERAIAISEVLSNKETEISLIQDYESLYLEATKNSDPIIRDMSVTSIPMSIVDKTILKGCEVPELIDFVLHKFKTSEVPSTEEF